MNDVARKRLDDLYAKDGTLTPEQVLADAKRKESPLHGYFEWDDRKAAMFHRLTQARELIASYEIVIADNPVRAFVWAPSKAAFVKTEDAIKNASLWEDVFRSMESEVVQLVNRNSRMAALAPKSKVSVFKRESKKIVSSAKRIGALAG